MPEGGGSGGTEGNPSGCAPLENKNAARPGRGAPRGNTNAAGGRGPLETRTLRAMVPTCLETSTLRAVVPTCLETSTHLETRTLRKKD